MAGISSNDNKLFSPTFYYEKIIHGINWICTSISNICGIIILIKILRDNNFFKVKLNISQTQQLSYLKTYIQIFNIEALG